MRKSLFFLALTAMAFSACTSEEVIDESIQSNAIGFENVVKKSSRAGDVAVSGDLGKTNLDQFIVYGYYTKENLSNQLIQVFGGDIVTLNKTTGQWEYKNTRYWVPGAHYNFYAYSCADVVLSPDKGTPALDLNAVNVQDRELKINNFICDRTHQHDLIYARTEAYGQEKSTSGAPANANVSFAFQHVLSKINAVFISEFSSEYTVEISDVVIENFRNTGNYSPTRGWRDVDRKFENETTPIFIRLPFDTNGNVAQAAVIDGKTNKETKPAKNATTVSAYLIPFTYNDANVQLKFKIEVKKGNEIVLGRTMTGNWRPNWTEGFTYTYNIRLTGTVANLEPIVFEVSKDMNLGWGTGSDTATDITFSAN